MTPELIRWADVIFVMERVHRSKLSKKFSSHIGGKRVICLEVPDEYDYMDPMLIRILQAKVPRYLPSR